MTRTTRALSRRRLLIGAAGAVGTAILAACGAGTTDTTPASTTSVGATATLSKPAASAPVATTATTAATTGAGATAAPAMMSGGPVKLSFYSGGDVNVQDLWANQLFPAYKMVNPNVSFDLVFAEHGNGDQSTFDRVAAAKQAGKPSGVDIWETGLLQQGGDAGIIQKLSASEIANLAKVPQDVFGQQGGYGVPYRASSVVLAYNSKQVTDPPKTLDTLYAWIKAHPGQFTYNPPDTGGSGGAFVTRTLQSGIPDAELSFFQNQYDAAKEMYWDKGWGILKDLGPAIYQKGFYPKGNVPVLQALGKGEITVAPVWSDMSLSYLDQKLLPPEVKLLQIDPPFSGGASFVGVVADSQHKPEVYAFLNWLLTPDPQTIIVNKMNGYPGLDWQYMPAEIRQKYADIAKSYSFGFSSKFGTDVNQQWYEKVAGTPAPTKTP